MDHVYPPPSADTWKPNEGFAMTLIHGAGVHSSWLRMVTYSVPFSLNPPSPFGNSIASGGVSASFGGSSVRTVASLSFIHSLALSGKEPCHRGPPGSER